MHKLLEKEVRPVAADAIVSSANFPDEMQGNFLVCNTIEHFFDLRDAFKKIREVITEKSIVICDIADFMASCRLEGPPEVVAKVDHCFWLSLESAPQIFQRLGFKVEAADLMPGRLEDRHQYCSNVSVVTCD